MKKTSIALATTAFAGLSVFSAAPAFAVTLPFENCTDARNAGVFNIPAASPAYQPGLDADNDGFGCDAAGNPAYDPSIVDRIVAENTPVTPTPEPTVVAPPVAPVAEQQMGQMPVGGVDAGVATMSQGNDAGALALGGGLVLAALGGAYVVRRRSLAAA